MNLVIVHYHLRPGGVTGVICNQLRALAATRPSTGRTSALVLTGALPQTDLCEGLRGDPDFEVIVERIEGLGYSQASPQPERLLRRIRRAVETAWGSRARPLFHFHNHSLGKNHSVPGAVLALAESGERVLLHIHDFAEDRRARNYARMLDAIGGGDADSLSRILYPAFSNVHFALLNERDFNVLRCSGVQRERLHLLPNAARRLELNRDPEACRRRVIGEIGRAGNRELTTRHRLFLYPARGIRRKNLGEALLWSVLSPEDTWFGMSLAPQNPEQKAQYERWLAAAEELHLPFRFGLAGDKGCKHFKLLFGNTFSRFQFAFWEDARGAIIKQNVEHLLWWLFYFLELRGFLNDFILNSLEFVLLFCKYKISVLIASQFLLQ